MRFSYTVKQKWLLNSINLPLEKPGIFLLTGIESLNLTILTGIIGKLFPIPKEEIEWDLIAALVENYVGNLIIHEGQFPESTTYIGADPDRHILFSTVEEEMIVNLSLPTNAKDVIAEHLAVFGLDSSFVTRHIATLSGGERMKVVLALAFAKKSNSYILHGVLPWLDKKGRNLLFEKVLELKDKGVNIIFCEHEIEGILSLADAIYEFDGKTVAKVHKENYIDEYWTKQPTEQWHSKAANQNAQTLLEFKKVFLRNHPHFEGEKQNILLNEISLSLHQGENYFFIGDNGVGKSTIAELIFRIFPPEKGEIFFAGKKITDYSRGELAKFICYLAQFPEQQITLSTIGEYKKEILKNNNELGKVLLQKYLQLDDDFPVASLSFLQLKLLVLSFLINYETKLIILDEPTWGIDRESQKIILQLLHDVVKQINITMLIISHNEALIRSLNGKLFKIEQGNIVV